MTIKMEIHRRQCPKSSKLASMSSFNEILNYRVGEARFPSLLIAIARQFDTGRNLSAPRLRPCGTIIAIISLRQRIAAQFRGARAYFRIATRFRRSIVAFHKSEMKRFKRWVEGISFPIEISPLESSEKQSEPAARSIQKNKKKEKTYTNGRTIDHR